MADYCSVSDVGMFLNFTFGDTTEPTRKQVETMIDMAMDEIENRTKNAWREKTVSNEIHDLNLQRLVWYGIPVYLKNRNVQTFNATTDKIEIRFGNTWEDWSDKATNTGYLNWDYPNGIVYVNIYFNVKPKGVRITYRYGESSIPNDIREACAKLVAVKILASEGLWHIRPSGGDDMSIRELIEHYKEDIDRIIEARAEVVVVGFQ